ncbi:amino acid-binding ACT domain protein [Corynebacterium diphtheriae]|uniref:amino acid-binding ACT domain protein n=1 Tax=Corynebacterium diphtheriae TaxID=1717 RepID=UPI00086E50AC|nr:amino acid-binding ACT domain protein [Corynebacterium diphtheriae]MBG9256739.1 amino acid-binding ACT domain protein [Corynebacterium diphtheriae bv. mitis]MBG9335839.1 amino acid-binding ACT domain protein [Corynebacterium diphtheriae bv. gravis]ODS17344.1 amino acid-binding ACT domain protein [Corynebacterium diphtheriae]OJH95068.1 amino acid-binding ACT domain protein [Corynebacterium diphtheriae]ONF64572.1 amino acid-binding ACT domain protein [Corynebacterium diphtheriae]
MSYLIRVQIPDEPGSLGRVAEAVGLIGGNISSVDVVEAFSNGTVTDDMVVELPTGTMADELITAAHEVEGVEVDSIRPFSGRVDRRGQIAMLASVAGASTNSTLLADMVNKMPQALTSSWAILLRAKNPVTRVTASNGAPADDGSNPSALPIEQARILQPEKESWIPESWAILDSSLIAAPLTGTDLVLVIGRVGGPDYLSSEIEHIGNLGKILGSLLKH